MSTKRTVFITGCSDGGIGAALATAFQALDFHVFASARNVEKMASLQDLPNVTLVTLDVTSPTDLKAAVEIVSKESGGSLDVLISNAGHNHFMPILDEDIEKAKEIFEVNVWGPLALTQAFAPLVIKAKGSVVYITSISGYVNIPWMGTYAASKRSIEIIAETLRLELVPFGVSVLSIVTGAVKSKGQTYFSDFSLPEGSLYKSIEPTIKSRAQGGDGLPRMDTREYAAAVAGEIVKGEGGKYWCGTNADMVKQATNPPVPQEMMDAGAIPGTGLDVMGK